MIRVYLLPIERIDNTDHTRGEQYIHNAFLGVEGTLRKLIQDTTDAEHNGLVAVAISWREATVDEIAQLAMLPPIAPLPRDLAAEIDEIKKGIGIGGIGQKGIAQRIDTLEMRIAKLEV